MRYEYAVAWKGDDPTAGYALGWHVLDKFDLSLDLAERRLVELRGTDPEAEWSVVRRPIPPWEPIKEGTECQSWCGAWFRDSCTCGRAHLVTTKPKEQAK